MKKQKTRSALFAPRGARVSFELGRARRHGIVVTNPDRQRWEVRDADSGKKWLVWPHDLELES